MNEAMNIERGFRKSLQYAAIGFAIPVAVIGLIAIYHFTFHDIHPMDRDNDLASLPAMILIPSLGLALLFGLSAFGSFSPRHGLTFVRSLIIVVGSTLIAVIATQPRVRHRAVDPNAWLETAIPLATALIATIFVLFYSKWRTSTKIQEVDSTNKLEPNREIAKR